jgi:hypothetical protein
MHPATFPPGSEFCVVPMERFLDRKTKRTFLARPCLILPDPQVGVVATPISYICNTWHWILSMGELQPESLPGLFPDLQMVIANSFRHTPDKPRFRAVFFTSQRMTLEVYKLIYGWIGDKLEEAGYSVNRPKRLQPPRSSNSPPSGLDWKGSSPHSILYLLCRTENRIYEFIASSPFEQTGEA